MGAGAAPRGGSGDPRVSADTCQCAGPCVRLRGATDFEPLASWTWEVHKQHKANKTQTKNIRFWAFGVGMSARSQSEFKSIYNPPTYEV